MPSKINILKEDLEYLYLIKEMSSVDIAKKYNCHNTTIINKLNLYGIPVRTLKMAGNTKIVKERMSKPGKLNPMFGKVLTKQQREKISIGVKQAYKDGKCGYERTEEIKNKISKTIIEGIKSKRIKPHIQFFPNYNSGACRIIDDYGKKNGYDFQHAENGGEIEICGYWVDGYDKEKNVVIEYYEKKHKKQKDYDKQRRQKIITELSCKFIELKEWEIKNASIK